MTYISDLPERVGLRISEDESGCWLWNNPRKDGYGDIHWEGKRPLAHRLVWELLVGPIPNGMQLDHVRERGCLHRNCVNPKHLEPVTPLVNTRRSTGNNSKTHCPKGHEYTEANTLLSTKRLHRECKKCKYGRNAQWRKDNPGYVPPSRR
jgi:hypothetical protein